MLAVRRETYGCNDILSCQWYNFTVWGIIRANVAIKPEAMWPPLCHTAGELKEELAVHDTPSEVSSDWLMGETLIDFCR